MWGILKMGILRMVFCTVIFEISWLGEVEEVLLIASVVHSYFFDTDFNKAKQFVFLPKDLNW